LKIQLLLLTLVLQLPLLCHAEESEPFFNKDFAKSPERDQIPIQPQTQQPDVAATSAMPRVTTPGTSNLSERVKEISQKAKASRQDQNLPPQAAPLPGSKQTMQVAVVGAILDATNHELLAQQLADLVKIVSELKILISTIYCIGPRIELPANTQYEITKNQGRILFVDQQPKKYQAVTQSPTWILSALDQEIVIEGAGLLSQNLNLKGEITTHATEKVQPLSTANEKATQPPITLD
jgi:hypothetical protein